MTSHVTDGDVNSAGTHRYYAAIVPNVWVYEVMQDFYCRRSPYLAVSENSFVEQNALQRLCVRPLNVGRTIRLDIGFYMGVGFWLRAKNVDSSFHGGDCACTAFTEALPVCNPVFHHALGPKPLVQSPVALQARSHIASMEFPSNKCTVYFSFRPISWGPGPAEEFKEKQRRRPQPSATSSIQHMRTARALTELDL